jgi:hypothetical protein
LALHARRALGPLVVLGLLLVGPAPAAAGEFGIAPEGFTARMLNAEGNPEDRAGAHPDRLLIDFALNLEGSSARDLGFDLPPGLAINAAAVQPCPRQLVEAGEECPAASQVGSFELVLSGGTAGKLALFELESPPGQPVAFGTRSSFSSPVTTELRPGDFGISVEVSELPQEPIVEGHLELWGVPADHQKGTSIPREALLSAPSSCGPLAFGLRVRSWEEGAPWLSATAETPALTGCQDLSFEPGVQVSLTDPVADSPTGLRTVLSMPEESGAEELAQAQIKDVTIAMPTGIGLSPGGAIGLSACSDAELGLGNGAAAHCPASSKVGMVELASPAIVGALTGTIFLATEKPGQRFRVFVVVDAAGTTLKFVGALRTAADGERLSAVVQGLPPLAISHLAISFDGGSGALLASPLACGTAVTDADFDPYGGGSSVTVAAGVPVAPVPPATSCSAAPFSPQLTTTTTTRRAGRPTSFSSTVRRRQGEQLPARLAVTLPAGLSAQLGAVPACPPAAIAAASCPAASRVGSVLAEIGSGPSSAAVRGGLYVTGAYRHTPFGVLIELPAVIGPFDLGSISLRGGAELDARSGRLTVTTDRLPASFEGVQVRFQTIELSMDRPGFVRNPTNCAASGTDVLLEAQEGASARASSPFRARACKRLGFRPTMRIALVGRKQLHRHGRPGLRATVRMPPGDANLRALKMSLPPALTFSSGGLEEICSRADAIAGRCPAKSRIGSASATTSLLGEPLRGSLYVAQPDGSGLPDIWVLLRGGGIEVNLKGSGVSRHGRFVIELGGLPDIPLSSFALKLRPGGAISLAASACRGDRPRRLQAPVAIAGQNAAHRALQVQVGLGVDCTVGSR